MTMTYIHAIGVGFPSVQCHAVGDGSVYSDLVWDAGDPIPDQSTLDQWISANPTGIANRHVTVLAFRNRFTLTEKVTIEMASIDNPSASMQSRQLAATLRVSTKDSDNAAYIDLDRADTRAGVQMLETYGIIAAGRASQILDNPVLSVEVPTYPDH